MEENSELHMETDVSSTTDNTPDTQQTSQSHMDVEMVIVVEEVVESGTNGKVSLPSENTAGNESGLCTESKLSPQKVIQKQNIITTPVKHLQTIDATIKSLSRQEKIQGTSNNSTIVSLDVHDAAEAIDSSSNSINSKKKSDKTEDTIKKPCLSSHVIDITNVMQNAFTKESLVEITKTPTKVSPDKTTIKSSKVDFTGKIKTPVKVSPDRTNIVHIDYTEKIKTPIKISSDGTKAINMNFTDKIQTPVKVSPDKTTIKSSKVEFTGKIKTPVKVSPDRTNIVHIDYTEKIKTPIKISPDGTKTINMDFTDKIQTPVKVSPDRTQLVNMDFTDKIKMPVKESPDKTNTINMDLSEKAKTPPTKISPDKAKVTNIDFTETIKTPVKVVSDRTKTINMDSTEKLEMPIKVSPDRTNTFNMGYTEKIMTPAKVSSELTKTTDIEILEEFKNPSKESVEQINIPNRESPEKHKTLDMETREKLMAINKDTIDNKEDKKEEISSNNCSDISEKFNDSQTSEKEHNKSISRELRSLIKSAKESKIISECTQLTTKTRKSRVALDSSNTSLNTSTEAEKIQSIRRSSNNSQKSNSSEKSEKVPTKRSMRSQNPEFVFKVKKFLNSVTGKSQKSETDDEADDKKEAQTESTSPSPKKKKNEISLSGMSPGQDNKLRCDPYCWRCHWHVEQTPNEKGHPPMQCTVCPRAFHYKCLSGTERNKINLEKSWVCPECLSILHAESSETRSAAMKKISLGDLCELLNHALERMMELNGVDAFMQPVDRTAFPDYDKYVVHPMDLTLMKHNIAEGLYGSTEAFLADAQWILHNSIIFNTLQSKLTSSARALMRSCRTEMGEIEACPQCYAAAHARRPTWFIDVCSTPHILLWAKLKGFPYWPAKGMSVSSAGLVDVRFFGAHDRAWVPARDCFLFCEKDPNNFRTKRQDILDSMQEAELHIRNISRKFGKFVYPPFKTQLDPTKLTEQLKMMIPAFVGELGKPIKDKKINSPHSAAKGKSRSNSKSSKSSFNEGDMSENEEVQGMQTVSRKMADGAEIAQEEIVDVGDEEKLMEVEVLIKDKNVTRKRRRSDLEEAVITIIDTSCKAKRPKLQIDDNKKNEDIMNFEKKSQETSDECSESTVMEVEPKAVEEPKETAIEKVIVAETLELPKETISKTAESIPEVEKIPSKIEIKIKPNRSSTPKEKDNKTNKLKQRAVKPDKSTVEKDKKYDKFRVQRNSKNISLENNQIPKDNKVGTDTIDNAKNNNKESDDPKNKESDRSKKKEIEPQKANEKTNKAITENPIVNKDRTQFDDDTSLAVLSREVTKTNSGLPTISSVRSLSTVAPTETNKTNKITEATVTADSDSSIFTPTSTDNVRNMREAVNKLQKLKNDTKSTLVGKVGVRAFARMKSPEREKPTECVEVEIKSEPIDLDDADRQSEKMHLMNAFRLRPVNPNPSALRGVRINKVVVSPLARKTSVSKPPEIRVKAKKTFPQPRKIDDGRSELNSKNSMVYIPIQPPASQAPIRATRPITVNGSNMPSVRPQVSNNTSIVSTINTVTSPLVPMLSLPSPVPTPTIVSNSLSNPICVPTVGQVPFITSVNGQWTFSLQPVMSVGGIDGTPSPPIVNGVPERSIQNNTTIMPIQTPTIINPMGQPVQIQPTQTQPIQPTPKPPQPNNSSTESAPGEIISAIEKESVLKPNKVILDVKTSEPPSFVNSELSTKTKKAKLPCETKPDTGISTPRRRISKRINSANVAPASPLPVLLPTPLAISMQTNSINENCPREPPRLQQRPPLLNPLDSNTPIGSVPAPSYAGPLTAKLNQNAVKLTDFFKTLLEDSLDKIDEPAAQLTSLKLQLEQVQWRHQQEVKELKHNHDLTVSEMRASYEKAIARGVNEARRTAQVELEAAVKAAKAKQWCANCSQEAQFYCCWNTSYCDYPCQKAHWSQHFNVCTQQRNQDSNSNESGNGLEKRLQPAPDNLPKSAQAPALTVGGKVARPFGQDATQKTSIIVSMMEDKSGNQTVKCVGTYKPANQVQPLILNNQLKNSEEASKVVTSGGYLIVGAGNGNQPVVTSQRRQPSIQYYT